MKEIMDIIIDIQNETQVRDGNIVIKMIAFTGVSHSKYFNGTIMPGGIDRQIIQADGQVNLSARYVMEGIDGSGQECRIYIDNIGTIDENGIIVTEPVIYTDSKYLKEVFSGKLSGKVAFEEDALHVRIYG